METFRISKFWTKINCLRDIEQRLELFEVCVPAYFQIFKIFIVIWPKMNGGFRRKQFSDQYIGVQVKHFVVLRKIQLLSEGLQDFLNVQRICDLRTVVLKPCPSKLVLDTSSRFPRAPKRLVIFFALRVVGFGLRSRASFPVLPETILTQLLIPGPCEACGVRGVGQVDKLIAARSGVRMHSALGGGLSLKEK